MTTKKLTYKLPNVKVIEVKDNLSLRETIEIWQSYATHNFEFEPFAIKTLLEQLVKFDWYLWIK